MILRTALQPGHAAVSSLPHRPLPQRWAVYNARGARGSANRIRSNAPPADARPGRGPARPRVRALHVCRPRRARALTPADRFTKLIANGATGGEYVAVRLNTNHNSPVTDVASADLRCNAGAAPAGATVTVAAGSTLGFEADQPAFHPGPFNMYLARAPGAAAAFDGAGAVWARVWTQGARADMGWDMDQARWTFVLPRSTPPGEYLLRIEHIALHAASVAGGAQFYISCAQIRVTGSGTGGCCGGRGWACADAEQGRRGRRWRCRARTARMIPRSRSIFTIPFVSCPGVGRMGCV